MIYLLAKKTERSFGHYKVLHFLQLLSMVSSRCVVLWFLGIAVYAGAQTDTITHFRVDAGLPRLPILNKPSKATNLGAIYINDVANGGDGVPYWYDGAHWRPLARNVAPDGTVINLIYDSKGRAWMDRNLGAIHGDPPSGSPADPDAYGFYFQWCRFPDGHEKPNSEVWDNRNKWGSDDLADNVYDQSGKPYRGKFIKNAFYYQQWCNAIPDGSDWWNGGIPGNAGVNNPCPPGFHVPTAAEFQNLGFSCAGDRSASDGHIENQGTQAFYWTSTRGTGDLHATVATWSQNATTFTTLIYTQATGCSVRCIRDTGKI